MFGRGARHAMRRAHANFTNLSSYAGNVSERTPLRRLDYCTSSLFPLSCIAARDFFQLMGRLNDYAS